ncbi:MAG: TonB-dependent receptor [Polyangiales bacterium]
MGGARWQTALLLALSLTTGKVAADDEAPVDVVVVGKRRDPEGAEVAASDFRINVGELSKVPRDNAQKLLTLAPGLLLTNHGGEGHAAAMYLRGFDAGEGEDVALSVDGVPLNEIANHHGHGYADITFLPVEVVRSVRVVEGPFDPAQGDFAVAGSADFTLGLPEPGLTATVQLGAFARRRLFLGYRPRSERPATFLAASFERGDGFGPSRAFARASVLGQHEAKLGAGTYVRTLAFFAANRWDSAGIVPERAYRTRGLPCEGERDAQFFCTFDPNQGGAGQRGGVSAVLERGSAHATGRAQLFLATRTLRSKENFTGFSLDPRLDGGPQRGDLRDGRTEALTLGLHAHLAARTPWLGRTQTLTVGVYARHDITDVSMDRVRRELDVPYLTDFDRGIRQSNLAAHARVDAHLLPRLRLMLGVRADAFMFQVQDRNLPTVDRIGPRLPREAVDAYGFAISPRGGIDIQLHETLRLLLSVGQGARSSDATALSEAEAAPFARVTAAEIGLAHRHTREFLEVETRGVLFATRVSRDLVFDAEAGRNEPVGASHRSGGLLSARTRLAGWLDVLASATYTRAHLTPGDARAYALFDGPRLPFVPAWLVRGDAVVAHPLPFPRLSAFASVGASYVGQRPLPLGAWAAPYAVLDASVGARYRLLTVAASVTNLLDARYREAELNHVSNFAGPDGPRSLAPARHFSAGAPRQWLITLGITFDPQASGE